MANPQQPELRRSGKVAALDPDATETDLTAHDRPKRKGGTRKVPAEQRPGHHPEVEQDKPDLDAFAERLGIVPEGEEPADAPRVEDDDGSTVTRIADAPSRQRAAAGTAASKATSSKASAPRRAAAKASTPRRTFSPIGLALVGPVTGVMIARRVLRVLTRRGG
jgi:hypothetical protein